MKNVVSAPETTAWLGEDARKREAALAARLRDRSRRSKRQEALNDAPADAALGPQFVTVTEFTQS
jgi:hypothetical protein